MYRPRGKGGGSAYVFWLVPDVVRWDASSYSIYGDGKRFNQIIGIISIISTLRTEYYIFHTHQDCCAWIWPNTRMKQGVQTALQDGSNQGSAQEDLPRQRALLITSFERQAVSPLQGTDRTHRRWCAYGTAVRQTYILSVPGWNVCISDRCCSTAS